MPKVWGDILFRDIDGGQRVYLLTIEACSWFVPAMPQELCLDVDGMKWFRQLLSIVQERNA